MRNRAIIGEVHRRKRGLPPGRFDAIVKLFQPANCAGDSNDMGALRCQPFGRGGAQSTGCAGDESDAVFKRLLGHGPRIARSGARVQGRGLG